MIEYSNPEDNYAKYIINIKNHKRSNKIKLIYSELN